MSEATATTCLPPLLIKYRSVIKPLVLVLCFDLLLLSVNYVFAIRLESSAAMINVAGRQRMLSQRIAKSSALIHYQRSIHQSDQQQLQSLWRAADLFESTLAAFQKGGTVRGADGLSIDISGIKSPTLHAILARASSRWKPIGDSIRHFRDAPEDSSALAEVNRLLSKDDDVLLELMNDLTVQLEQQAARDTWWLRTFQTTIVALVLGLFTLSIVRLYRSEKYYDTLMEASNDIVLSVSVRSGKVSFISHSVEHVTGWPASHYLRESVERMFTAASASAFYTLLRKVEVTGSLPHQRMEAEVCKSDGASVTMDCVMSVSTDESGVNAELVVDLRDITERKQYEMKLKELAHRDALTGLPNRNLFFDFARQSISRAERQQDGMAIMFVDLDGFKAVNDQYGHEVGDQLLCRIAERLSGCLRQSDTVCRLGGDEFVVLVEQVKDPDALRPLCEKILETLSREESIEGERCQVGVSIGIAVYPRDGQDPKTLVNRADAAMYAVKHSGKGGYRYFSQ